MFFLTRREQQIIVAFFLTFLLGFGVKAWRGHAAITTFHSTLSH